MATHFSGPVNIGGSVVGLSWMKQGTVAVDPGSITANTSLEVDVTIAGVAAGDVVIFGVPASLDTGLAYSGNRVSAANTVKLRLTNATGSDIDDSSRTWTYAVLRFA